MNDDPALAKKQIKAEQYALQPERFTLLSLQMEVRSDDHSYAIVECRGQAWSCTCDDCNDISPCVHVLAVQSLVAGMPPHDYRYLKREIANG